MAANNSEQSVGLVQTRIAKIRLPPEGLRLERGGVLPELQVAYETYGALNPAGDNAIFVCHALSGDAHVAGRHSPDDKHPGWWDEMVGPGKGLDTRRFFVICANILGGCKGTTGPSSIDPRTGRPYGSRFPIITVGDIVNVHRLLLEHLGIRKLYAVVGGSFGGMQVLEWGIRHPDTVERCICIAAAASLSAQALAFDVVGREVIMKDPAWADGDYYETGQKPTHGLAAARMIGHITYLSREIMAAKFGRRKQKTQGANRFRGIFDVERYLQYQGARFVDRFDSNSYLHITYAMDEYDLVETFGTLPNAFQNVRARFLVVALSSDWLFPPEQSRELANALVKAGKRVTYCLIPAPYGHDGFLVDIRHLSRVIRAFLSAPPPSIPPEDHSGTRKRADFELIEQLVPQGVRVLDLGCGDGELLARLAARRACSGLGLDIDLEKLILTLERGLDVFQGDIDEDLDMIPDQSYDCVILSQTLQVIRRPREVLRAMLRIGREGIVSMPNFAHWPNRLRLGFRGRMPKTRNLPFEWYETPNIHLATLRDFVALCRQEGIAITKLIPMADDTLSRLLIAVGLPNLGAERVLVKIQRAC